ncbi:hypothetical protein [Photobacterium galatheae]|nr:hypothetical protein [Photobacterium galatheae]
MIIQNQPITVIPAQAGIHWARDEKRQMIIQNQPITVIPAQAGIH